MMLFRPEGLIPAGAGRSSSGRGRGLEVDLDDAVSVIDIR